MEVPEAFMKMSPEEFEARYDFKRPAPTASKQIVTMCKMVNLF